MVRDTWGSCLRGEGVRGTEPEPLARTQSVRQPRVNLRAFSPFHKRDPEVPTRSAQEGLSVSHASSSNLVSPCRARFSPLYRPGAEASRPPAPAGLSDPAGRRSYPGDDQGGPVTVPEQGAMDVGPRPGPSASQDRDLPAEQLLRRPHPCGRRPRLGPPAPWRSRTGLASESRTQQPSTRHGAQPRKLPTGVSYPQTRQAQRPPEDT